jgi:hypothetical protein
LNLVFLAHYYNRKSKKAIARSLISGFECKFGKSKKEMGRIDLNALILALQKFKRRQNELENSQKKSQLLLNN